MTSVLYTAKQTCRFQQPPYERVGVDEVLLLRVPPNEEGQPCTWRLPRVGEFEHAGESEPLTDTTKLVRVDARFEPAGLDSTDYFWCVFDLAHGNKTAACHADVRPALERLACDQKLDQILARVDSTITQGNSNMSPTIQDLQRQIDALTRRFGADVNSEQRGQFIAAQSRADVALRASGDSVGASPPVAGEKLLEYRARLLAPLQKHSARFKNSVLSKIQDPIAFGSVEDAIYADAMMALKDPNSVAPGQLREIKTTDPVGRTITSFVGRNGACWDKFKAPYRFVKRWGDAQTGHVLF